MVVVLGKYKAIGWTMEEIKGISSSICMHKILLDDYNNKFIKQQRRLNPVIMEVVKKETIKWLNTRIIYQISGSSWVSLIEYVPKKGRMIVVPNEKKELIAIRIING